MGGVYTYSLYALVQTIQIYVGYDISKSSQIFVYENDFFSSISF